MIHCLQVALETMTTDKDSKTKLLLYNLGLATMFSCINITFFNISVLRGVRKGQQSIPIQTHPQHKVTQVPAIHGAPTWRAKNAASYPEKVYFSLEKQTEVPSNSLPLLVWKDPVNLVPFWEQNGDLPSSELVVSMPDTRMEEFPRS